MSRKLVMTELPGFDGPPRLPDQLIKIHDIMYQSRPDSLSGLEIEELCQATHRRVKAEMGVFTLDGYIWYRAVTFFTWRGQIAILFPWAQDWNKMDGSQSDRSLALYATAKVTNEEIQELLDELLQVFQSVPERHAIVISEA